MLANAGIVFSIVVAMITAPEGAVVHECCDKWNNDSVVTLTKISNDEFMLVEELNEEALNQNWCGSGVTSMRAEATADAQGALEMILHYAL